MGQVKQYINAILASVNETDGWVGPGARPVVNGKKGDGNIYWGRSNAMFSLMQYAEAEKKTDPAEYTKVATVMKNYFLCQKKMMAITPIEGWAAARWIDMALSVAWVLDQPKIASAAEAAELMEMGKLLHEQGSNWDEWFMFAGPGGRGVGNAGGHNVNNAQALKSSAVWYLFSANETMKQLGRDAMKNMDAHYGLPTGMFNGDEILPDPPTRNPSRGIETCGVVEAMFSYVSSCHPPQHSHITLWSCAAASSGNPLVTPNDLVVCRRRLWVRSTVTWSFSIAQRELLSTHFLPRGRAPEAATCGLTRTCRRSMR